jgi:hypothetical protein
MKQKNLLNLLIKKFEQVSYNIIQNIIIPSKFSIFLSSNNQLVVYIILSKFNVSIQIITLICLFL